MAAPKAGEGSSQTAGIETARTETALTDLVRAEQVRLLYADGGVALLSTLAISVLLVGLLVWQHAMGLLPAALWLTAMTVHTVVRAGVRAAYLRAGPVVADWRPWANRFVAGTVASGLTWGAGMPWLLAQGRFDLQLLVMVLMVNGTYGIIGSAGAYLPAFWTFILPFPPVIFWFAAQGDTLHLTCAVIIVVWLPQIAVLGRRYNAILAEALELRFQNAALADGLRAQTHVAEQTSLARSRFLAAASHDLRQPVHALGMFVGALRSHKLPARSQALIGHIDASVGALDGLFTSLLDISKLDAGVVEARPEPVLVQPLLARICRDLAGEAAAKGVDLVQHPTRLAVQSDPVHLERVLRNLIGNAVRHTARGRVVVGVRRQGRVRVRLEVWDTGPGIAAAEREAIFEEFYQLANPDRDRAKGLGLGLAIVRRLTAILRHELSFDSRPGRGSVFRLALTRAEPPAIGLAAAADPAGEARAGAILVIDDEAPIRIGMTELLEAWGHRVLAAAGGDEALDLLAVEHVRPRLIISDYRLRGEDGIAVIRRLQRAFGQDIPAILLTGDTAAERIREARASGYPLLHKPVSHVRLRAAVTGLLTSVSSPAAE